MVTDFGTNKKNYWYYSFQKKPTIILLNVWDCSSIPINNREIVFSLLLAAKATIAFFWKKPIAPTVEYWVQKIWDFIIFDKILFSLNLNSATDPLALYNKWYLVLDYFAEQCFEISTPFSLNTIDLLLMFVSVTSLVIILCSYGQFMNVFFSSI